MTLEETLKLSTAAAEVDTKMAQLEKLMKTIPDISDTHRRMVANARQAMSSLVRSLRPVHEPEETSE